ncbi:zinc ribbon domain-containing protein [bacterium]|nr:zinc ribbon domain-containing protein [bacterium]MBU1600363.1 zinc ribbon domain-containing protein [bacterium]MBU2461911.1 zinc ribbon domain-containing protein [bacterium]
MPIYEYKCNECVFLSEFLIRPSHKEELVCQKCGGTELTKIISTFSIAGPSRRTLSSSSCTGCSTKSCSTCK